MISIEIALTKGAILKRIYASLTGRIASVADSNFMFDSTVTSLRHGNIVPTLLELSHVCMCSSGQPDPGLTNDGRPSRARALFWPMGLGLGSALLLRKVCFFQARYWQIIIYILSREPLRNIVCLKASGFKGSNGPSIKLLR